MRPSRKGVRPNSPPITTSVSSSKPRCRRSLIKAAMRPVHRLALVRQAVADVFAGVRAVEIPAPVEKLHEADALLHQPPGQEDIVGQAARAGLGPVGSPGPPSARGRCPSPRARRPACGRPTRIATIRVSVSGWPSCRASIWFRSCERIERHAAQSRGPCRPGWKHRAPGRPSSGTARPGKPSAGSRSRTSSCRRWAACRWRSAR